MNKVAAWGVVLLLFSLGVLADEPSSTRSMPILIAGMMVESACMLEMQSATQEITLGTIAASLLKKPGSEGEPVPFVLHFKYCVRMHGSITDSRTGSRYWDSIQPIVTIKFLAPTDGDSPALVKVTGAQGLGLRISDARRIDVRLGERSKPQFLTPGSSDLVFYITPERTAAPLVVGPFRAVVNFLLEYE